MEGGIVSGGYLWRMAEGELVLLLLGGDLGDPEALLTEAEARLAGGAVTLLARSRDHWTEAVGFDSDRRFLNRALLCTTRLGPVELMQECLAVEAALGRTRNPGAMPGPRLIDIDILLYGALVVDGPIVTVPHPRMHQRAFALAPAADVAPGWVHPLLERAVLQLLDDLPH